MASHCRIVGDDQDAISGYSPQSLHCALAIDADRPDLVHGIQHGLGGVENDHIFVEQSRHHAVADPLPDNQAIGRRATDAPEQGRIEFENAFLIIVF